MVKILFFVVETESVCLDESWYPFERDTRTGKSFVDVNNRT